MEKQKRGRRKFTEEFKRTAFRGIFPGRVLLPDDIGGEPTFPGKTPFFKSKTPGRSMVVTLI